MVKVPLNLLRFVLEVHCLNDGLPSHVLLFSPFLQNVLEGVELLFNYIQTVRVEVGEHLCDEGEVFVVQILADTALYAKQVGVLVHLILVRLAHFIPRQKHFLLHSSLIEVFVVLHDKSHGVGSDSYFSNALVACLRVSKHDVLFDRLVEEERFLLDDCELVSVVLKGEVADVCAIDENLTFVDVIEAQEQRCNCTLA